jgi:hypothetical protein
MNPLKALLSGPLGTALSIPSMSEATATRDRKKHRPLTQRERNAAYRSAMDEHFAAERTPEALQTWGGLGGTIGPAMDAMNQWGMSRGNAAPQPPMAPTGGVPFTPPPPAAPMPPPAPGGQPWWMQTAQQLGNPPAPPAPPPGASLTNEAFETAAPTMNTDGAVPMPKPAAPPAAAMALGPRGLGVDLPRPQARPPAVPSYDTGAIPGFNPSLPNMVDPTMLGDMKGLKARTVYDSDSGRAMNDFYREDLMSGVGALLKRAMGR